MAQQLAQLADAQARRLRPPPTRLPAESTAAVPGRQPTGPCWPTPAPPDSDLARLLDVSPTLPGHTPALVAPRCAATLGAGRLSLISRHPVANRPRAAVRPGPSRRSLSRLCGARRCWVGSGWSWR